MFNNSIGRIILFLVHVLLLQIKADGWKELEGRDAEEACWPVQPRPSYQGDCFILSLGDMWDTTCTKTVRVSSPLYLSLLAQDCGGNKESRKSCSEFERKNYSLAFGIELSYSEARWDVFSLSGEKQVIHNTLYYKQACPGNLVGNTTAGRWQTALYVYTLGCRRTVRLEFDLYDGLDKEKYQNMDYSVTLHRFDTSPWETVNYIEYKPSRADLNSNLGTVTFHEAPLHVPLGISVQINVESLQDKSITDTRRIDTVVFNIPSSDSLVCEPPPVSSQKTSHVSAHVDDTFNKTLHISKDSALLTYMEAIFFAVIFALVIIALIFSLMKCIKKRSSQQNSFADPECKGDLPGSVQQLMRKPNISSDQT